MVTQNPEPTQGNLLDSAPPAPEPAPEPEGDFTPSENPIIAEVDRLNGMADAPEGTEAPAQPEAPITPVAEQPAPPVLPDQDKPVDTEPQPAQPQLTPQQIEQMRQESIQLEQLKQRAAIQQEQQRVQRQYEQQGFEPQQAQYAAQQYAQSQQARHDLIQKADEYGNYLLGRVNAAEHFAQKYNLDMSDLPALRQAPDETTMDTMAKKMSQDRRDKAELEQLRKQQVPAQQYDNSQGAPEVATNDGSWLDRYNNGDRSANAVAAAKRVLGI